MAEAHQKNHDYHIIDPSPWPLLASIGAFVLTFGGVGYMRYLNGGSLNLFGMNFASPWLFYIGLAIVLFTMFAWWADTIKEAHEGHHTRVVSLHLRYGMIMFIASEVMFFVAWFWAFFDASLFANEAIQASRVEFTGGTWPPQGIEVVDPWHLPLYNTVILLLSGTCVTWAHHAMLHNDRKGLVYGLLLTVLLGALFSFVQAYEYAVSPFDFTNSIYGA
ncbi:MAG: cytochrome c oxidase subunit 3, partial [Rhizobium rhizophilum]